LRFAAAAALWTLRRAADFCFAVGISSLRGIAHSAYCTIGTLRLSVLGARNCRQKMT
jgi:presenilin-like A22 family membrane protease